MGKFTDDWRVQHVTALSKKNNQYRKRRKKDEPYLCSKCNKVWQPYYSGTINVDYLLDFPKLGCTDRTCTPCKDK
mgnify:FL=1|jgi:hypothetical protein